MTRTIGLLALLATSAAYAGDPAAETCPAEVPAAANCDHAINTKGTGTSGRCAGEDRVKVTASQNTQSLREQAPDAGEATAAEDAERTALAIKTKGTSAQRTELAIKTKGTSAQRTGGAPPADCNDSSAK